MTQTIFSSTSCDNFELANWQIPKIVAYVYYLKLYHLYFYRNATTRVVAPSLNENGMIFGAGLSTSDDRSDTGFIKMLRTIRNTYCLRSRVLRVPISNKLILNCRASLIAICLFTSYSYISEATVELISVCY